MATKTKKRPKAADRHYVITITDDGPSILGPFTEKKRDDIARKTKQQEGQADYTLSLDINPDGNGNVFYA